MADSVHNVTQLWQKLDSVCCSFDTPYLENFEDVLHFYVKDGIDLQIVRPVSALLVIDVQNDFISGSLAVVNCPAGEDGGDVS